MKRFTLLLIILPLIFSSCDNQSPEKETNEKESEYKKIVPEWAKDAIIYEVNIRQHTPEGTFNAFVKDIPRLKEMGIDILWLMPIHQIGELNRKGSLGSYYSIYDYKSVNPEFGTMEDFKNLVNIAHEHGMYVLLDWVANHTSWDAIWTETNPDFYHKDSAGNFMVPVEDWEDVIHLDFDNEELRTHMIDALKFWIIEANIDGYRCDVADMVPTEFWDEARMELDKIKPVFMLAEAETPEHHYQAFDMSYGWWLMHVMNGIAKGEKPVTRIDTVLTWEKNEFPEGAIKMRFTTNHDENSWNGTVYERYGEGNLTFSVLCYTLPGMPLIYSGQEAGMNKRLRFFEKDTIDWSDIKYQDFYTKLNKLKKENVALWNGEYGGDIEILHSKPDSPVFAFKRSKDDNIIIVILNLSDKKTNAQIEIEENIELTEYFSKKNINAKDLKDISLDNWEYRVYINL